MHDEAKAFAEEAAARRQQGGVVRQAIDKLALATVVKSVVREGIEVVFIVIAIGASGQMMLPASVGAPLALLVIVIHGLWLRRPLARVPENARKFGVGVMLAAFGAFWVVDDIGLEWPGSPLCWPARPFGEQGGDGARIDMHRPSSRASSKPARFSNDQTCRP